MSGSCHNNRNNKDVINRREELEERITNHTVPLVVVSEEVGETPGVSYGLQRVTTSTSPTP